MRTTLNIDITLEQGEDGLWCAHADLGELGDALGDGPTREEAMDSVRQGIIAVLSTVTLPSGGVAA
ncbi:hypothetical protein [Nocardiopsis sp. CNT312]|uniref:hypothetical protein n=1 Tax=Nocardiopsis sp. CNT312 TaxID=1137268 RepID=UPI0004B0C64F|nr:hypothetical protein [Nocardiopsis sp. CNT312]